MRKNQPLAIAEFAHAVGLLVRRVRNAGTSDQLSLTETSVVKRLANGGPATTAELARAESVKPQSMGTIVAALEEIGFVERKPHPSDGRQVNIQLTAKGLAAWMSLRDARETWLANAIAQLEEQERDVLFAAGKIIKRLAES